ncbi:hypothetical protein HYH03_009952 [Edaphochlamys debaryana]|uniref:Uncharacterized protein n=1 Tax=Edaphochlamys debaryana TaxID=47281 RepID=A0A835XV99_9CHLO|nr:hypothetical protein HYH03_009952 [Edaphochlamys debaryana]|eukprot:KAG2491792.1 hypothetical protein HYH03_009952 [Edaphochlamys debaryana]
MSKALKEHRFEEALEHARTAIALDPNNVMVQQFIQLLEEKQQLGESTDEEEGAAGADGSPGKAAEAGGTAEASSSESSSDDDEDEDEGETDEEGEGEEGEESSSGSEASDTVDPKLPLGVKWPRGSGYRVAKALGDMRLGEAAAGGPAPPPGMSAATRNALRSSLAGQIKDLKQQELAAKMAADDPLLRA